MAGIGSHHTDSNDPVSPGSPFSSVMEISEEKRSKRNPNQLDFELAMAEFRNMFPAMDPELIESVLRANHGTVDETIDQLLTMASDEGPKHSLQRNADHTPPSLPPKPPGSLRSSNERLTEDTTPALPPREGSLKRNKPKLTNKSNLYNKPSTQYDTEWNGMIIPMLGKLPSQFLRLQVTDSPPPRPPKHTLTKQRSQSLKSQLPMHLAENRSSKKSSTLHTSGGVLHSTHGFLTTQRNRQGHLTTTTGDRLSTNVLKRQYEANQRRLQETCDVSPGEHDSDSGERFLEDERLALIMQNEEFLRELKRNEDFMRTLEFERDLLASKLVEEQRKNRQFSHLTPSLNERTPPNWMVPRLSERDDNSLPRSLSPSSDLSSAPSRGGACTSASSTRSSVFSDTLNAAAVPVDKTDKTELDFREQLRSMGASSKKKFAVLAKKFFSTSRKKRKAGTKILRDAHGPSTLNLLDDNDDEDLIDTASGEGVERDTDVLFEPLPDAWTAGQGRDQARGHTEHNELMHDKVWL